MQAAEASEDGPFFEKVDWEDLRVTTDCCSMPLWHVHD